MELRAGAGTAVIEFPQEIFPVEGFVAVHDNPHARLIVFEKNIKIAIMSLELVMVPDDLLRQLRLIISEICKVSESNIWIHVTHAITTLHPPEKNEENQTFNRRVLYEKAICDAVYKASMIASKMQPSHIGIMSGNCFVNVNRDNESSTGWWIGTGGNELSNKEIYVIKFETPDRHAIGYLLNYGLKPCCIDNSEMDKENRQISSDVPGMACNLLEEKFGVPVLYTMSAAADQVPIVQAWYDEVLPDGTIRTVDHGVAYGLSAVKTLGEKMAKTVEKLEKNMICNPLKRDIIIKETEFFWPLKVRKEIYPRREFVYESNGREGKVPVGMIRIDNLVIFSTRPEICCATAYELKQSSCCEHTLLITMVNGGMKYMPDQLSYDRITWEAQSSALMPGAAEQYVKIAGDLLNSTN